jgi:hypothetical protein
MAIATVDKPHKSLQNFINRVRTASYGYAPLFAENDVDATALDQLAAFDRALADQHATLSAQIERMDRADPQSPDFKAVGDEILATVQGLDDRFDMRNDVLVSGSASTDANVLALLDVPEPNGSHAAYRLHEGEAIAVEGANYTIIGRVSVASNDDGWRAFQLRGGDDRHWLIAPASRTIPLHWARRIELPENPGTGDIQVGKATYTLRHEMSGTGDIIGPGGSAREQPVRLLQYEGASGQGTLDVFEWGENRLVLEGHEVDHAEVDFFTRET